MNKHDHPTGAKAATETALYGDHIRHLQQVWGEALDDTGFEAVVVAAGEQVPNFLDDQPPPFRVNPHFNHWLPETELAGSALLIQPGRPVQAHVLAEADFWHAPPQLPSWAEANAEGGLKLHVHATPEALTSALASALPGCSAYIGPQAAGNLSAQHNPADLLARLHFARAIKTPFELELMRRATRRGVAGHIAAAEAFARQASEFEIGCRFLEASGQLATEQPYSAIVALNEHAGVLHYQHMARSAPARHRSFLLDAGARESGYASDITRTWAGAGEGSFAALIEALNLAQLALIERIRPGVSYVDLHDDMARRISAILHAHDIVDDSPEAIHASGLVDRFFPHGLGHLIGLQTHDVGGRQIDASGAEQAPPERYPALRTTRPVEAGQVFTIEPGIYFIPMLLEPLRDNAEGKRLNWSTIESLYGCGGIRIEDNVIVGNDGCENMTRDAFAAAALEAKQ